jgi:hypothetical protein
MMGAAWGGVDMRWYSNRAYRIRFVTVIASVVGIIGVGAVSPVYASAAGAGLTKSATSIFCGGDYPNRVEFTYGNGLIIPDLTVCANTSYTSTSITNTSEDVIWHVYQPYIHYWTLSQDIEQGNPATLLFRLWVKQIPNAYLTIEPGVDAILNVPPSTIRLGHNAGEEAAWQVMSLMADSVSDKAHDAFVSLLEDDESPTAKAVIECANTAYSIGQTAYNADQGQVISSQLSGMFQSGAQCSQAVDDARDSDTAHAEEPVMNLHDIEHETHIDVTWDDTDALVEDIAKFIDDGLLAHVLNG